MLQKNLQHFFPPTLGQHGQYTSQSKLTQLAEYIAEHGSLVTIAQKFDLPPELALDLARLSLFEIIVHVDDSGSMCDKERAQEMMAAMKNIAFIGEHLSNGIKIRFFNSQNTYDVSWHQERYTKV